MNASNMYSTWPSQKINLSEEFYGDRINIALNERYENKGKKQLGKLKKGDIIS
ncbi:MAG: hypothetical protein ACTSYF_06515 [Promethearchaeota archaeon]